MIKLEYTRKIVDQVFRESSKRHRKDFGFGKNKDVERVMENIWKLRFENAITLVDKYSESPIETQVGYALVCGFYMVSPTLCSVLDDYLLYCLNNGDTSAFPNKKDNECLKEFLGVYFDTQVWLIPNAWINKKIRCDFALCKAKEFRRTKENTIIIECDSFQYHGNREGFIKDKKRERELIKLGYNKILRFSGHEICRDPKEVALEIMKYAADIFYPKKKIHKA